MSDSRNREKLDRKTRFVLCQEREVGHAYDSKLFRDILIFAVVIAALPSTLTLIPSPLGHWLGMLFPCFPQGLEFSIPSQSPPIHLSLAFSHSGMLRNLSANLTSPEKWIAFLLSCFPCLSLA